MSLILAACIAAASSAAPSAAVPPGFEVRICALVEAPAAAWSGIQPEAVIDPAALSWRRKAFLSSSATIPVASPEVRRALSAALASVPSASRSRTIKVLDAVGAWVSASVLEDPEPLRTPGDWRGADEVIRTGHGNAFERVRVLVALLRAAGIPAKPGFNGVPMVVLFVAPGSASLPGEWTVWDPLHPAGSFCRLPVAWMPLRAGDVPLVATAPAGLPCRVTVATRRWAGRDDVRRAWETVGRIGAFPSNPAEPLPVGTPAWWEIWIIGVAFDGDPGAATVTVPLPFAPELKYGTRDQTVWASDPARLKAVDQWSETDQRLGGLVHGLRIRLSRSAAGGGR
ncbi:MAG: transglutaminase domain-containing protein [Candidatus Coatesbacteria bacterium]